MGHDLLRETSIEDAPLVPARILNEYTYCPRLAYIEWVQGEFEESADTLSGSLRHRRVDQEVGGFPGEGDAVSSEDGSSIHARSVMLSSARLGLIARMDLVESSGSEVIPVDYKRGRVPDVPGNAWEPDRVQLCAQALILRDNGYQCTQGIVYYSSSKTRVTVNFDESLVNTTLNLLDGLKATASSGKIPPPLNHSSKCERCSLAGICLPDEINLMIAANEGRSIPQEPRRLVPALKDSQPVYVQEQGAMVSKNGDVLQVKKDGSVVQEARLLSLSHVSVFGNVQISTQLLRELGDRGIPVCYFTYGGWFAGLFSGMSHKNVELRREQFGLAADEARSLRQSAEFVYGKIKNARTMLRRNSPDTGKGALAELSRLALQTRRAGNLESLLGIEGAAARTYFSRFGTMLKPKFQPGFDFKNRNRRPSTDPVNALLSFTYGLLVKDLYLTLLSVGFDPMMGFLHRPRYGKPALALDLAEEFRPLVGDSVVLTMVNGGEVGPHDFVQRGGASALTAIGRRKVISAYERRLNTEVRHPVFGYSVSYRRVMEVQARLLSRRVVGEIQDYVPFVTR
ncbi:MAG: CRISPR-associated endonuclease Cas1 [Firmicutes bacterium]|nr:CRISPR-associated endonuclease Cas1 [Bacillota bacterium]